VHYNSIIIIYTNKCTQLCYSYNNNLRTTNFHVSGHAGPSSGIPDDVGLNYNKNEWCYGKEGTRDVVVSIVATLRTGLSEI